MSTSFARTPEQEERLRLIGQAADKMKKGAHDTDLENGFSHHHIELLREIGYPGWTVPREYGGAGISLYEFLLYQERLAQGDPAIALGMGWHLSVVFELGVKRPWSEAALERVFRSALEGGLTNRANSEKATGSPSRGGRYQTTAKRAENGGYVLNGRKTFTTLSPALDTAIVGVTLEEEGIHADFLIPMSAPGVSVDPTWNVMGMRGTGSHDLVLDNVELPEEALVFRSTQKSGPSINPYLLHVPACYLGIALAARAEALAFAADYQPNTLDRPILYAPNIGQHLSAIDLELSAARHYFYSVAARYEESDGNPDYWLAELGAVKVFAVQTALSVVDKALRITGAHGLRQDHPLQRLYRDVRFGLSNPPMEDSVMRLLHQRAIQESERTRE
ncbi:acyl-CoA dehydrogenase family protein [Cohnella sp. AR92]|uniref:acyl-CoA dehydrogenase family protein n=1 Tax=Cohnella sp. AR92 TaxID=648716 RepID=UPI000F8ECD8C|nr:acyl-CoA dehydrogenase family protein [Cohnella sp. AR92]RUS47359.1 acyl-CoA dehydrogenase [Cohnella sp. AR92]